MMSKGFAVGAALLAALVPCVADAGPMIVLGDSSQGQGTITFTSPTSFSTSPPGPILDAFTGDAAYYHAPLALGGAYVFSPISGLPGTSPFIFDLGPGDAQVSGTVDWTAVEGYPASPELIGTFTSGGVGVSDPSALGVAEFAADFPVGA